jgi:hypothetical protein
MAKFTFMCNEEDDTDSSLSFNADYMGEVLEKFEQFLKGSGYYFEGNLEFVTHDYDADDDFNDDYDDEDPIHDYAPKSNYNTNFTIGQLQPILVSEVKPLTSADVAALQGFNVAGSGSVSGYGAVPPTMAPLQPLTPKDLNKWSL